MTKPVQTETILRAVYAVKPVETVKHLMQQGFTGDVIIRLQNGNMVQFATEVRKKS